jgi:methylmalonyl-CoA mutase N-terminal domain/subunit
VEALTAQIETGARALIALIEERGGMVKAIESGWVQQQIADSSWEHQRQVEGGERVVVGVNRFVEPQSAPVGIHRHLEEVGEERRAELAALRAERDGARVASALHAVRTAAAGDANLVPVLVEAVKTYATIGEICGVLREVFGEYRALQVY